MPESKPVDIGLTLTGIDAEAIAYVLPVWNGRRAEIHMPPHTESGLAKELLQEALHGYARVFHAKEVESLMAVIKSRPELLEQVKQLAGLPSYAAAIPTVAASVEG